MTEEMLGSFEKINYLLRPSKQVERKIIIEIMHRLANLGYAVTKYTYVGLGSVYYADFILFHKYLYLDKMICAELSEVPNRMEFNKPYHFIRLKMKAVNELIPSLSRSRPYLVWLDYDYPLRDSVLFDLAGFIRVLTPGSVLIVTVDAEPRLPDGPDVENLPKDQKIDIQVADMDRQFGKYYPGNVDRSIFSYNSLPVFYAEVIRNSIQEEVAKKKGAGFLQLFNFKYADGAQMLSMGGLVDSNEQLAKVRGSNILNLEFINEQSVPIEISVPSLTIREKQWLDQKLHTSKGRKKPPFEIRKQMLENYVKYRRHYPTYFETLT